jgi:signal transduction histidine kinase
VLVFGYVLRTGPFSDRQRRLALGVGQATAAALENARLISDLQTASRIKSEFVSTMSHELRTPLHVIMGYTDMVEDLEGSERREALGKIRATSRELLELIEATLNLNRLESGHDTPNFESVPVAALWDELRGEFDAVRRTPGVALRFEATDGLLLLTDRRKLKIVIKNLVGNALKFTPSGEVVATCRREGSLGRITVRDTGIGIEPEALPHIFEMFRQVDSSDRRSYGGVGLGLHIVRRLVEQLRGEIRVDSEAGIGSIFTVTLPLAGEMAATAGGRAR